MTSYDIIGDIHGQADKLEALLRELGYTFKRGIWRPTGTDRQAIFVGDMIDRGPRQVDTLRIVRGMIDAGHAQAVLGNHEFNAVAWHRADPRHPGQHLRRHTDKNRHQHGAFLGEVGDASALHGEWADWFMTLPLWLDLPGVRVVHACWHPEHMATLQPLLSPTNSLTEDLVEASSRAGTPAFLAAEAVVKGLEIDLPPGVVYQDAEGNSRTRTRVRWWDPSAHTYRSAALIQPELASQLPELPVPDAAKVAYDGTKPLFFGHYWFQGTPMVLGDSMCCVDYSAARRGPLVAYRWEGENKLDTARLVAAGGPVPDAVARPRV